MGTHDRHIVVRNVTREQQLQLMPLPVRFGLEDFGNMQKGAYGHGRADFFRTFPDQCFFCRFAWVLLSTWQGQTGCSAELLLHLCQKISVSKDDGPDSWADRFQNLGLFQFHGGVQWL